MPTNINIPGGDTVIIVSSTRQFRVHSQQLRQSSTLFQDLLDEPGPTLSALGQKVGIRYLIVLQTHSEWNNPQFLRMTLDPDSKPTEYFNKIHEDDAPHAELFSNYQKVIGSFFNIEIKLDTTSVDSLAHDCIGLVEAAEYLYCVSRISKIVESALLSEGQNFFRAIANDPLTFLDLSYRLESKVMFKEALIHTIGQYNRLLLQPPAPAFKAGNPTSRTILDQIHPPQLRELVDKKHRLLKQQCMQVEREVATHYPIELMKTKTTGRVANDKIGRANYAKDAFAWVALACYRQWLGQVFATDKIHHAPDNGYALFKVLSIGGQAYLDRGAVSGFHENFAMSKKGESVMEANLDTIKSGVVEVVQPMMVNNSQVESKEEAGFEIKWLTCVQVGKRDYIWEKRGEESVEGKGKGKKRVVEEMLEDEDEDADADADAEADETYDDDKRQRS